MRALRPSHAFLLLALLSLTTLAIRPWSSARAAGQLDLVGMLATYQPATDAPDHTLDDATATPATLRFYSADAELVHEVALPLGSAISANALAPDGRHWAYLSGAVSGPDALAQGKELQRDLTLHIVSTLDGTTVITVPLLPSNFPNNISLNAVALVQRDPSLTEFDDLAEAVWLAFKSSLGLFAWSLDGTQLAFSAATDGPSTDLYLYDLATNRVTRLTDGIEQIEGIRWSPDGTWIWHSTISYGYCQVCDGHHYAAAADGSTVVTLPGNDIYRFLGWVDDGSYLVTDQANGPGTFALQRVEIATGISEMLWDGVHEGYVYDPANLRLGIIGSRERSFDPDTQVFIVDLATGQDEEFDDLVSALAGEPWLAPLAARPLNHPCHRAGLLVHPCLETPFDPLSPDGDYRVTSYNAVVESSSGARILPFAGKLGRRSNVLWRPDSAGIFFVLANAIYYRTMMTDTWTTIEPARFLRWLPHATPAMFAAPTTLDVTTP